MLESRETVDFVGWESRQRPRPAFVTGDVAAGKPPPTPAAAAAARLCEVVSVQVIPRPRKISTSGQDEQEEHPPAPARGVTISGQLQQSAKS